MAIFRRIRKKSDIPQPTSFSDAQLLKLLKGSEAERGVAKKYLFHHEGYAKAVQEILGINKRDDENVTELLIKGLAKLVFSVGRDHYGNEGSLLGHFKDLCWDIRLNQLLKGSKEDMEMGAKLVDKAPKYRRTIFDMVLRNSGSQADAEDIYQEGLVILWENIGKDKFKGESQILTYFRSICWNNWLKELERRKKKPVDSLENEGISNRVVQLAESYENTIEKNWGVIKEYLTGKVKAECLEIMGLKMEGYIDDEIAAMLNKAVSTIKNTLGDCRKTLRNMITSSFLIEYISD